ncbi:MAG TPA: DUF6609 family protein [Gammaproteobacteria bacterium]
MAALAEQELRYPIARSGGLFLLIIGAGLLAAIAASGDAPVNRGVFYAALGAALVSLCFARRVSLGRPTPLQIGALVFAVALQGALIVLKSRLLPHTTPEHVRWLWVAAIVGIHFLPMAVTFGPRMLLLGSACIATALAGLSMPSIPYEVFGIVDGALKVAVGAWLLATKPTAVGGLH